MSTDATPASRLGCSRTNDATSSLSMSGPCGPHHAESNPTSTPALSMKPMVADSGSSGNASCFPQRSNDSSAGCARKRLVGCCIQASMMRTLRSSLRPKIGERDVAAHCAA
jgi:hypothetical protein